MSPPKKIPRLASFLALLLAGSVPLAAAAEPPMREVVRDSLEFSAAQYAFMLSSLEGRPGYPRSVAKGEITLVPASDWTSGFFPGSLWYLFEATGDPKWRMAAATATAGLKAMKENRHTHDLGFMLYCSYGNALRLAGDADDREVLLAAAESLSTRFNATVGSIKSWDHGQWAFPVIIDNMMNLELLCWAARAGNQPRYREIAVAHADTTLRNHFRADGSSYHVVAYDPVTGKPLLHVTHQGAADESAWARGQAWGLYGFTMMYRETRDRRYLEQAKKIADFLVNHPRLPADKIPYWDFDAPDIPAAPRDASAAAIMCSALLELSDNVEPAAAGRYAAVAEQQLRSLASPAYRAKPGENHGFLLMHSTGNFPKRDEVDVPINYADYYFLEALLRSKARLARLPAANGHE
ncbi:MAG: glucuronyl hydrolase [Verrucomicrobia bacterium]|nr:glucuronyl hydrolase [Verrucomicrobiota bacterium]